MQELNNNLGPEKNNSGDLHCSDLANLGYRNEYEKLARVNSLDELVNGFKKRLANMCGATDPDNTQNFSSLRRDVDVGFGEGLVRSVDHLIIDIINEKINHPDISPDNPLRVLEVGSGSTFPRMQHFGSPWLSRYLANQHQDLIDVTCSDVMPPYIGYALFIKLDDNVMFSSVPLSKPAVYSIYENGVFQPVDEYNKSKILSTLYPFDMLGVKAQGLSNSALYSRPSFDSKVEHDLFGINFEFKVDYYQLDSHFPDKKFDIVFSRHLVPNEDVYRIEEATRKVLADDGVGISSVDVNDRSGIDRVIVVRKK
jgi:hypothetical protein